MKTVLVTGGAGYVGSHACKALYDAGYIPVTYDDLSTGHVWAIQWGPWVNGHLEDRSNIEETLRKFKPFAVMHFAAKAYVGESTLKPEAYYQANVLGSLNLLQAMRAIGVKIFVFSSSCATYGIPSVTPIPEHHPQLPINPYGRTKLTVEWMLRDFDQAYGVKSVALRYFNAAGADPDGLIGELHVPETHIIPVALDVAAGIRDGLDLYGDDYPTHDGTCIRDYVHVSDLAHAHVLSLEYLVGGGETTQFNLSAERGTSVKEVIKTVEQVTGYEVRHTIAARRPGDPPVLVGNSERARQILSWKPRYPHFVEQVKHAWMWHQHLRLNNDQ